MNKFSMGNAFSEAKAFVMQAPFLYVGIVLASYILAFLLIMLTVGGAMGLSSGAVADPLAVSSALQGMMGLFFLVILACYALMFAGYYAVWRHGLGNVSIGEAFVYGLKACIPALIFIIVAYIILVIGMLPFIFLSAAAGAGGSNPGIIGGLFLLILFFGGIYLLARLSIMGPEMAAHNSLNPFAAAGRSWTATQGNGWMIALYFVVAYIIFFIAYFLLAGIAAAAGNSGAVGTIIALIVLLPVFVIGIWLGVGMPAGVYLDLVGRPDKTEIFA